MYYCWHEFDYCSSLSPFLVTSVKTNSRKLLPSMRSTLHPKSNFLAPLIYKKMSKASKYSCRVVYLVNQSRGPPVQLSYVIIILYMTRYRKICNCFIGVNFYVLFVYFCKKHKLNHSQCRSEKFIFQQNSKAVNYIDMEISICYLHLP